MSNLNLFLKSFKQKGNLAYEYNPFKNYQTSVDIYSVDGYQIPYKRAINPKNGELLIEDKQGGWIDKRNLKIEDVIPWNKQGGKLLYPAGSLIDLDTDLLNFDLNHPIDITVQPSYDGSVNLILNDNKNIPRLINSRFSPREKNTYEIVDRIGENDTNIYNSETFEKDTSLYFQCESNPIIKYTGFINGILPVGSYFFYFTYCDADNNESDFIAESGIIPVFIGSDGNPNSMDGGIKNQVSNKGIKLKLSNLDKSYNYLKIYYVRYFADYQQNRVYECKKIYQRYPINSNILYLQITGNEKTEDIDANLLNIERFNPQSILTQTQCKNMLFFGNIVKNTDNYKELQDCALRIVPELYDKDIENINNKYTTGGCYYDSKNIYNNVGYFNQELYRFGVVFIYKNGTLSNVYNTLGGKIENNNSLQNTYPLFNYLKENEEIYARERNFIKIDDFGWIEEQEEYIKGSYINSKGVCQLQYSELYNDNKIFGIKFNIPKDVIEYLQSTLGIRGLFFVRQKCVPNILAQCYLLPFDKVLEGPVIKQIISDQPKYYTECFVSQGKKVMTSSIFGNIEKLEGDRELNYDYDNRLYEYQDEVNSISINAYVGICPDFLLNQPYYNQIFNGSNFKMQKISFENSELEKDGRYYIEKEGTTYKINDYYDDVIITSVTDDVPQIAIKDQIFRLKMGVGEEVYRFRYADQDNSSYAIGKESSEQTTNATNIVRGIYSPYIAIYSSKKLSTNTLYNIYRNSTTNISQEYQDRMNSSEPFYAISDRYNFSNLDSIYENNKETKKSIICWRGDCYLNTFTYRLNRNFNDPSLPNNDEIIDKNTWKDHYDAENSDEWANISRSDVNAVQLGSWITFKIRSATNYALRSEDHSYVSEEALMGSPRSFYPKQCNMQKGNNKQPDSYLFNDAYRATLGFKCYFSINDINYIKDTFSNRIQYSAISIQDSFKNNYRESLSTYFRDYSQEYGGITKLIGFEGHLLVVLEHAIGIATVNERILAGNGEAGEPVFINTKNVLPEELTIISDTIGSQWSESVIKSEAGYVYGVDTIAKKIWRVQGNQLEILSDFRVNKFLIENISLGERENFPIIGLKNVKTHYNNNKKDIMFTFYDDIYKDEEKVWNLCFNELLNQFITFYSWIPSYSENIDTQFFSFNRNTSKELTLLEKCNYSISNNSGVLVNNPILFESIDENNNIIYTSELHYIDTNKDNTYSNISFKLEKDHWENYKWFKIENNNILKLVENKEIVLQKLKERNAKTVLLQIIPIQNESLYYKSETIAVTFKEIVDNKREEENYKENIPSLYTDFFLHGQSGIFDIKEDLYPTYWYGEYHPFEFEFIVNDKIGQQKIFNNLVIISNKAEPESFHFEIEGDNYEFSEDKRTMYFRQEATKELYQNLGSNILFDRNYKKVANDEHLTYEQYYRSRNKEYLDQYIKKDRVYPTLQGGLVQQVKSTIFPLYYERTDTYNEIYDKYEEMTGSGYDFKNLSGSEIKWNRDLNQFNIVTHIKNSPIDKVGILRGNSYYKEGEWNVQIPSIIFNQKNEEPWKNNIPPIVINTAKLPKDLTSDEISTDKVPNIYTRTDRTEDTPITDYIKVGDWTYRKETRIRDKWMKVRVRYSGKNLAIIHSLITLYNISYA